MKPDKLWKLALEDLQVSISQASFNSWILPLKVTSVSRVDESRILVDFACPSTFHQQIIDKRYYGQLKEAVDRVSERKAELRFSIDPSVAETTNGMGPLFTPSRPTVDGLQLAIQRVGLREDFTFDTFAVSSSNEMAHAAAVAVADNFGSAYNPLFLYGGVGVGKTHLAQAVANKFLHSKPEANMIFCMSEEFTNGIIEAIQQKKTPEFRRKYRQVNGLFIDDIQFIAGKTTVQEEFFHTFNAILKAGGQVVLTSDRSPNEIPHLEARLRSRFEAGLLVDIGKPDFELKAAIALIKAGQRSLQLSMEDAQLIAGNVDSARQIEGFITRLATEAKLRKKPLNESLIRALLGKTRQAKDDTPPPMRPMEIVRGVAAYFNVTSKQLRGGRRVKQLVTPRHIAMYLLRVDYKLPLTEIGSIFSDRDHTTVMHAVEKITTQLKDMESLRIDVGEVRRQIYT